jgi:hypothetical protein
VLSSLNDILVVLGRVGTNGQRQERKPCHVAQSFYEEYVLKFLEDNRDILCTLSDSGGKIN